MSTGAECNFYEMKPNQWHYQIQKPPYGWTEDYFKHGPFPTFKKAIDHMQGTYANPGGYSVDKHPDHKHDFREVSYYGERQIRCHGCDDQAPPDCGCESVTYHRFGCENFGNLNVTLRMAPTAYSESLETQELPERLYEYIVEMVNAEAARQTKMRGRV